MKRGLWLIASLWASTAAWGVTTAASPQTAAAAAAAASAATSEQEAVTRYCVTCHNDRLKTSGLSLEKLDVAHAAANPVVWENVVRKIQARAMPPAGARRPDEATYRALQSTIERELDTESAAHPNP